MTRRSGTFSYTQAEMALELEEAAAASHGEERLDLLAHAAKHWAEDDEHARALTLFTEVIESRREYPELDWALPAYAYSLFAVGRTEEAWAAVDAAEAHARARHSSAAHQRLADYLDSAGQLERAERNYTAALDLLLDGGDREPAVTRHPRETSPVARIRTDRRRLREQLGLPRDEHDLAAERELAAEQPASRRTLRDRLRGMRSTT
ncbi:hypothetical protein [Kitasatospora sp. NPDC001175]|uniref:hypothetical protein n=1 Tax=Kitasatospora sp. NPDC001175 TaxID=3157103 RepID=UPI003D04299F